MYVSCSGIFFKSAEAVIFTRAFINLLKKDILSNCLRDSGISVEEMRSRLRAYLDKEGIPPEHETYIQNLRLKYDSSKDIKIPSIQISRASSPVQVNSDQEYNSNKISEVCDKVRKWGVKYDGGDKDPLFLRKNRKIG